jgi:HPt (histidine-containing phosphotransfer) domain-containing protein
MQNRTAMPTTADTARVALDATDMLHAIWRRQQVRVGERVELIEHAAHALGQGQLGATLRDEAQRAAHMLAGSLGTFGFADASRAALELELELAGLELEPARPMPARAAAMTSLLAELRRDLRDGSEQQRAGSQQGGDQQDHERLPDEQAALVAPVA